MTRRRATIAAAAALLVVVVVAIVVSRRDSGGGGPLTAQVASALAAATRAVGPFEGWRETRMAVGTRCLRLVVARTTAEREQGLRGVTDLSPYDGMVFVMPRESRTAWTMAGAPLPLDLGLYDRSGLPIERHALVPCPTSFASCPLTRPANEYRLGVETPRGSLPAGALTGCGS